MREVRAEYAYVNQEHAGIAANAQSIPSLLGWTPRYDDVQTIVWHAWILNCALPTAAARVAWPCKVQRAHGIKDSATRYQA